MEKLGSTLPKEYQNTGQIHVHTVHTVKGNVSGSTVAEHAWDSGRDINWDFCKIVDKENHWKKGKHLESFTSVKGDHLLTGTKGLFLALIQHYMYFIQRNIKDTYL